MGASRETTRTVEIGAAATVRVFDNPEGEPTKDLIIRLTSRGTVLPAGDLDWSVITHGVWSGTPFASGSTLTGGTTVASGIVPGGTTIEQVLWSSAGPFPANRRVQVPYGSGYIYKGLDGFPISVSLTNNKASTITVYVTFNSDTVTQVA